MKTSASKRDFGIARVTTFLLIVLTVLPTSANVLAQESPMTSVPAATVFDPTAETPDVNSTVPTEKGELFSYLTSGAYTDFAAQESAPHATRGPHTDLGWPVRVFLDPMIAASLEAGNTSHPAGSSIVKEMYDGDGVLQGWAVMVKTSDNSANGKGWFWYEVTSTKSGSDPVAIGNGVQLCQGCHFIGKDFVLSTYPLQ